MDSHVNFDINEAIKRYDSDPASIDTPDAPAALQDCEHEPESLNSAALINAELNPVVDAVAESPEAITRSTYFDTLQFLLKCVPAIPAMSRNWESEPDCYLFRLSRFSSQIPPATLGKILDLIVSALSNQADIVHADIVAEEQDALQQHKTILGDTKALEKPASAPAARGRGKGAKTTAGKDGTWDASAQLEVALDRIWKVLKLNLGRIFVTTSERDTFIGLFTKPVYYILENEARVKNTTIRLHCFRVLCIAVKYHGHAYTAQTSINQSLTYFEHLSEPMAEFLQILANEYDYPQLTEDVLRDVSSKEFSKEDQKGPKSISTFLTRISEVLPHLVIKQMTLLANLLDSESYTLRCAMIDVCGNLIIMISKEPESDRSENHKIQLNYYFDVLADRFLDVNPYCRCRVMQAYIKICELEQRFSKRRQEAAGKAARSLQDKSSNVRRNAIKLLSKLVTTHPFNVYREDRGQLDPLKMTQRLEDCDAQINALRPSESAPGEQMLDESMLQDATQAENVAPEEPKHPDEMTEEEKKVAMEKITKLQEEAATARALEVLEQTRKYYSDVLRFIGVVNEAAELVMQLLSAKNKSEVIEAMDFFTTIDAYKIPNARQGIRRMLRLIWTKGNSDEGKGIQAHLIECYRNLFFVAPDGYDKNDTAKYITQNMITLTYGTTPAELTSLEQLLSTMMTQGLVSNLVIEKLWSMYGHPKGKSRTQRRGAIIVLGMLALAKPTIIVEEMELCLRIGLGELGRSDLGLARYTCIALGRISPPPGKQSDPTAPAQVAKLPNDHAVLVKLAAICEMVSDDKEWFGVAEQALNAIYVLSKHPDVLCSDILRRKTKHVFTPQAASRPTTSGSGATEASQLLTPMEEDPPETAVEALSQQKKQKSALALSQLLFIVGHVAIKQIVHLELCESEFKRRKAEKEKKAAPTPRKSLTAENPSPVKKGRKKSSNKEPTPAPEEVDELDLMAGTTEDDFTEAIVKIREEELLHGGRSLLANFGPLVRDICHNNTSYNHPTLVAQAALCLGKLMCVSPDYCQQNISLLLTILERSNDAVVRSNLVIALADVAVCFNHVVDENEDFLYRRLNDREPSVKRTSLMTLTLLILSGRIKVKGQLGEMAKSMEDSDKKIADMARTFFTELATKDNAIYNQFTDMFSVLSSDKKLDEDAFKRIIKTLAGYIEKDKHAKQLAKRLADRLHAAENEKEWNHVAFTLGQLQHKDEEIQNLVSEGFKIVQAEA
ncbi:condensin complex non-SMC subunit Cnd1 [Kalmusia sp. IMI 367209]|nr:condensin complex non-SMC subunit Cnd1 [Kalmusia sp. IMI 367209]